MRNRRATIFVACIGANVACVAAACSNGAISIGRDVAETGGASNASTPSSATTAESSSASPSASASSSSSSGGAASASSSSVTGGGTFACGGDECDATSQLCCLLPFTNSSNAAQCQAHCVTAKSCPPQDCFVDAGHDGGHALCGPSTCAATSEICCESADSFGECKRACAPGPKCAPTTCKVGDAGL